MQGLFFVFGNSCYEQADGVANKIKAQIDVFNRAKLNCKEFVFPNKKDLFYVFKWRLPFFNVSPKWFYDEIFSDIDYIYMRRPFVINKYMVGLLQEIRRRNPKIKMLIEIPTYPYDPEYDNYKLCFIPKRTDICNRKKLKDIIDYFVTVTDDEEIFGVKTIKIKNGISFKNIGVKKFTPEENGTIHMCAVAHFKGWHGYERFFVGLADYYKNSGKRNIVCDFVGEGSELPNYKKLVKQLSLEKHINFLGFLNGEKLLEVYNRASISLGSFGAYKKDITYSCDLKSRESLARGIPMIVGCKTEGFVKGEYKYYYEFPNDPTPLDVNKIIEFHDNIYTDEDGQTVINNIRAYGERTIDMSICMKAVIDYLQQDYVVIK